MRRAPAFFLASCLLTTWTVLGSAEDDPLAWVSGGGNGKVYAVTAAGPVPIYSAKKGFKPEGLDVDGMGRIFACDPSNSEIHVLQQDAGGNWDLTTIFDKGSAVSPSPEQPVGCHVVGADLLFGERSGSGGVHGVWKIPGAATTPTSGPFAAPLLLFQISAVSGDEVTDVFFAPDASILATLGDTVLVTRPPAYATLDPLITGLAGQASAVAQNSVGETFVALADLGIIEVFDAVGAPCGIYADVSPLRPTYMEFDLSDNLYFTAPRRTNGRNGDVFVAAPHGGPATRQCDLVPPAVAVAPVAASAPEAEVGIALPPSSVSQELVFEGDDPLTAKLCSALFSLDPEFLNALADPDCPVTVTCRMLPRDEFEVRTAASFADTICMDVPSAGGNCMEIVVDGAECFGGITELEWLFFVVEDVDEDDCPGLLYGQDTGPTDPYTDDILTEFQATVPDLPNDPGLKAEKLNFGSALVGVTGAPNRPPVADAGEDVSIGCGGAATVTLDGSASHDPDPVDAGQLTYSWDGPAIPAGAEDDVSFAVAVGDLGPGSHVFELTVTDTGTCAGGALSDSDSVTITVDGGSSTPTIDSLTATPGSLWPPNHAMVPIVLTVEASAECGDVTCHITGVHSTDPSGAPDDPDSGNGAGTYPDWVVTPPLTLELRAERSEGGDSVDDTRIYTIGVSCTTGGDTVDGTVEVWVVSDQGG